MRRLLILLLLFCAIGVGFTACDRYGDDIDAVKTAQTVVPGKTNEVLAIDRQNGGSGSNMALDLKRLDPAFLMHVLELREELAEAKVAGDRPTLERLQARGAPPQRLRRRF